MCIMVLHKSIIHTYVVAITKYNGNYTAFQLLSKIEIMWDYSQSKLEIMDIFTLSGMDLQYYQPREALASRGWLYCKSIPREVNISIISNLLWE